MNFWKTETM